MEQVAKLIPASPMGMQSATSGNKSSESWNNRQLATPSQVGVLFKVFARRFSHKWEKTNNDPKARSVWLQDLRHNGVTDEMINAGIVKASTLDWPPSCGEFIKLCRPSAEDIGAPAPEDAYSAAAVGNWSLHPLVWHAAKAVGTYELRNHAEANTRPRFLREYDQMVKRYASGERFDLPVQDVPQIERKHMSKEACRERIAGIKAMLKGGEA